MTRKSTIVTLALVVLLPGCGGGDGPTGSSTGAPSEDRPLAGARVKGVSTAPTFPTIASRAGDLPTNTFTTKTYTTPPPPTTPPPLVISPPPIPSDILFDTASSVLKPQARPYLIALFRQIQKRYPGAHLTFVGFTDSRGDSRTNLILSTHRAQAVLSVFAANRYPLRKLTAVGRGEQGPLVRDTDAHGSFLQAPGAKNRRVEIQITP